MKHFNNSLKGNVALVNGMTFRCTDKVEEAYASMQRKSNAKYFVAAVIGDYLWVYPEPISKDVAVLIRKANHSRVGCFAMSKSLAQGLCGYPNCTHHDNTQENKNEGYFKHFHPGIGKNKEAFHCWYV